MITRTFEIMSKLLAITEANTLSFEIMSKSLTMMAANTPLDISCIHGILMFPCCVLRKSVYKSSKKCINFISSVLRKSV